MATGDFFFEENFLFFDLFRFVSQLYLLLTERQKGRNEANITFLHPNERGAETPVDRSVWKIFRSVV